MATERKAQPIPEQYLDLFEKPSLGFLGDAHARRLAASDAPVGQLRW